MVTIHVHLHLSEHLENLLRTLLTKGDADALDRMRKDLATSENALNTATGAAEPPA
jgi:hypothetical protein